jgi:hypothetical protein
VEDEEGNKLRVLSVSVVRAWSLWDIQAGIRLCVYRREGVVMAKRCLSLNKHSLVIVIALLLINGLSAVAGATGRHQSLADETPQPTTRPTVTVLPTDTPMPTLTPTPLPDLVVAGITADPPTLLKDRAGTVRVEVKNTSSTGTAATCWVGLYIDRAPVGEPSQQGFAPALGADQSAIVPFTVALADVGYHSLSAWVDFLQAIPEGNEGNNQLSASVLVAEPTHTPSPTSTPSPTTTPSSTPTPTTTLTPSPTSTPSPTLTPSSTRTPLPTSSPRPGESINLAYNGGFEGAFISREGFGEVADGWTPFVQSQGRPQFLRGKDEAKGQSSQRIWSDYVPFQAGIAQRIVGVTAGHTYIARADMLSIFGEGDTPVQGMNIGKQIGLDPRGGDDPSSPHVVWSDVNWRDRAWQEGEGAVWVSATAEAGVITLFIRMDNVYGGHHDLCYVDEVSLHSFETTPTLTPSPTHTPTEAPTSTPLPTFSVTPLPQGISTASATPLPPGTATATPVPTLTAVDEPQPHPISTPAPTASPASRSIRRFIPLFFVLAFVIIVVLVVAILWLQEPGR